MNILQKIGAHKKLEVEENKEEMPIEALELLPHFQRKCLSLSQNLKDSPSGIITEFKRRSPSHPQINLEAQVENIIPEYVKAGAAGISVLTDEEFFGGHSEDLLEARELVSIPLLRKDFIVNEYQIYEAKALGADVILLIAAILSRKQIKQFSETAKDLGLEVLLEVHNEEELEKSLMPNLDMIGVNNRNLKTFEVDLNISKNLAEKIPSEFVKVSESGISSTSSILELQKSGFKGFLIGGNFMATADPGKSALEFFKELHQKIQQQ